MSNGTHSVSMADYNAMTNFVFERLDEVMREVNQVQEMLVSVDWTGTNSDDLEGHMNTEGQRFWEFNDRAANGTLDNIVAAMNDLSRKLNGNVALFPETDYATPALSAAASKKSEESRVSEQALDEFSQSIEAGFLRVADAWEGFRQDANSLSTWQGLARDAAIDIINRDVPVIIGNAGGEGGGGDGVHGFRTSLSSYVDTQLELVRRPVETGGAAPAAAL